MTATAVTTIANITKWFWLQLFSIPPVIKKMMIIVVVLKEHQSKDLYDLLIYVTFSPMKPRTRTLLHMTTTTVAAQTTKTTVAMIIEMMVMVLMTTTTILNNMHCTHIHKISFQIRIIIYLLSVTMVCSIHTMHTRISKKIWIKNKRFTKEGTVQKINTNI